MSSFKGIGKLRKTLRRIEPEAVEGIIKTIASGAKDIERDMIGGVPVDEGDLARSLTSVLSRDGLSAAVGPGVNRSHVLRRGFGDVASKFTKTGKLTAGTIRDRDAQRQLFKALWIEYGTKFGKPGSSAQPARPFMAPAFDANKDGITRALRKDIKLALKRASSGE